MRFFTWWSAVVVRYPLHVVVVALALMGGFSLFGMIAPKDLSFTGMLDPDEPELVRYREAVQTFGGSAALVILLEGEPGAVARAGELLVAELPRRAPIRNLVPPADPQWILDRAAWLWPEPLFNTVLDAVRGGNDNHALTAVENADHRVRHRLQPTPRAALLSMAFTSDVFDMAMGGRDYLAVTRAVEDILREAGVDVAVGYTGIAAIGAQDQNSVFFRVKVITPITMILVLALLYLVEQQLSRILLAGVALGGSVGMAFGLVALIMGKLSITATFFGMLLLGLGIDFAIHLLVAMRDAHAHGCTPEESVRRGLEGVGMPIVLGGLTTMLATGVLIFVPQPGSKDMGLTATLGLGVSLVMMLSFLPAAWLLLERRWGHRDPPPRMVLPGLHATVRFSINHPWKVLIASALLTVGAAAGLTRYHLESDLQQIMSRDVPALEVDKRIQEIFGIAPVSYLAPVASLDEARATARNLLREPDIVAVYSPSDWILPGVETREDRMRAALTAAPSVDSPLAARLLTALDRGPVRLEDLPPALRAGTVGEGGALAVQAVPGETLLDARRIEEQLARLRGIAPTLTGVQSVALRLMTGTRDWIPLVMSIIAFVVLAVLVISFRDAGDVALAFLPVVVGTLVSLGMFFWMGLSFSLLTGIVVPVIIGLGVDDGIHIVERLRHLGRRDNDALIEAVEGVGRAIFLTSATTTISFVGLFFCDHYGLESMAQFMTLGMPLCFIASVTVLPAAVRAMRRD